MKFIKLKEGIEINQQHVESREYVNHTVMQSYYVIRMTSGQEYRLDCTPEEIDRLLGIEETEAKPITKILTCKSCVGWVVFNSEKGCPECINGSMFEETPF